MVTALERFGGTGLEDASRSRIPTTIGFVSGRTRPCEDFAAAATAVRRGKGGPTLRPRSQIARGLSWCPGLTGIVYVGEGEPSPGSRESSASRMVPRTRRSRTLVFRNTPAQLSPASASRPTTEIGGPGPRNFFAVSAGPAPNLRCSSVAGLDHERQGRCGSLVDLSSRSVGSRRGRDPAHERTERGRFDGGGLLPLRGSAHDELRR
jgi:hypothetical protein